MNIENIDFTTITNANAKKRMSYADAIKNAAMRSLGEGKGIGFSFLEGEVIVFPALDQAFPWTKEFSKQEILYITGYSMLRKRFLDIPLATFRRRPAGEGEAEEFFDNSLRPLTCELAECGYDLDRFRVLCTVRAIKCDSVIRTYHQPVFEKHDDGTYTRKEGEFRPMTCFSIIREEVELPSETKEDAKA